MKNGGVDLQTLKSTMFNVPQDRVMSGSANRCTALLPQQGRTPSCGSRRGRQSVQPAHCAEGPTRGTVLFDTHVDFLYIELGDGLLVLR